MKSFLKKIIDGVVCFREHGVLYVLAEILNINSAGNLEPAKILYVSSDCYKMSGAFLSLLALDVEMESQYDTTTHVIFPYYGSGMPIVKEMNIKNNVINSSDWIIPIDTIYSSKLRKEHFAKHTKNILAAIKIAIIARQKNCEIIHSNTSYTYVGALAARLAGIPHVWHLREFLEEDQNNQFYNKRYAHKMLKQANYIVVISKALLEKYRPIVPAEKLCLIYNGVSQDYFDGEKRIFTHEVPHFLFVSGSDSPNKGHSDLIKAVALLKKQNINFHVDFVGFDGEWLKSMLSEYGIQNECTLHGYQKDTKGFYKNADITFVCSKFEAFGRTTVEASLAGSLVIGANTAGTAELIQDNKTGLLYEQGNYVDLSEKIVYALTHRQQMQDIASAGRQNMLYGFTSKVNAEKIFGLYQRVPRTKSLKIISYFRICWFCLRYVIRHYCISPLFFRKKDKQGE